MNLRVIVASFIILAGCVCLLAKSNVMADVVMADGKNLDKTDVVYSLLMLSEYRLNDVSS